MQAKQSSRTSDLQVFEEFAELLGLCECDLRGIDGLFILGRLVGALSEAAVG
jgi:hypothetical protein